MIKRSHLSLKGERCPSFGTLSCRSKWKQRNAPKRQTTLGTTRGRYLWNARLSSVWLVAGALSIECKQSEQSIGVVAMWWTLCSPTRTSLPATGSFLRSTICHLLSSGSLSLSSRQRTRSDISNRLHRLSLSRSLFSPPISLRVPSFVCSVRVIPGSNSSQSHAVIFEASRPIRKSFVPPRQKRTSTLVVLRNGYITIKSWDRKTYFS